MNSINLIGERCPDTMMFIRMEIRKLMNGAGGQIIIESDDPVLEENLNKYGLASGLLMNFGNNCFKRSEQIFTIEVIGDENGN